MTKSYLKFSLRGYKKYKWYSLILAQVLIPVALLKVHCGRSTHNISSLSEFLENFRGQVQTIDSLGCVLLLWQIIQFYIFKEALSKKFTNLNQKPIHFAKRNRMNETHGLRLVQSMNGYFWFTYYFIAAYSLLVIWREFWNYVDFITYGGLYLVSTYLSNNLSLDGNSWLWRETGFIFWRCF